MKASKEKSSKKTQEDEGIIMFQSTVNSIFDSIHSSLHQTIRTHVSSLPFLNSTTYNNDDEGVRASSKENEDINNNLTGEAKLYKLISNVYEKHMDMAQLYAEVELFNIDEQEFSRKKRHQIVQAYLKHWDDDGNIIKSSTGVTDATNNDNDNDNCDISNKEEEEGRGGNDNQEDDKESMSSAKGNKSQSMVDNPKYSIPKAKEDIPSPEQLTTIEDEIKSLRNKLRESKIQSQQLDSQLTMIQKSKITCQDIESVSKSSLGKYGLGENVLQDSVTVAMMGKDGLDGLCNDGLEMIGQLDEIKQKREDDAKRKKNNQDESETVQFSEEMKKAAMKATLQEDRPKKRITLEEDYNERTKSIGMLSLPGASGRVVSNLLKK